jgi:hypothetical protein
MDMQPKMLASYVSDKLLLNRSENHQQPVVFAVVVVVVDV